MAARRAPAAAVATAPAAPDPTAIATLAGWLAEAQRAGDPLPARRPGGRLGPLLSAFAKPTGSAWPSRSRSATCWPRTIRRCSATMPAPRWRAPTWCWCSTATSRGSRRTTPPAPALRVAHIGPDPHFRRMPVRGYRADLAIAADPPVAACRRCHAPLPGRSRTRRAQRRRAGAARRPAADPRRRRSPCDWLSHCVSRGDGRRRGGLHRTRRGAGARCASGARTGCCRNAHSGGLGWAMPAALGAQLARPRPAGHRGDRRRHPTSSPTRSPATRSPRRWGCRS